jgi:hypothetical protein
MEVLEGPKKLGKPARREPPVFKAVSVFNSAMENEKTRMRRVCACISSCEVQFFRQLRFTLIDARDRIDDSFSPRLKKKLIMFAIVNRFLGMAPRSFHLVQHALFENKKGTMKIM